MEITFSKPNKNHPNPFYRYQLFSISKVGNEKYPDMVEISRGPKWGKEIIGKKYLNPMFAIKSIDLHKSENLIQKDKKKVVKSLEREGFDVDVALEVMSDI